MCCRLATIERLSLPGTNFGKIDGLEGKPSVSLVEFKQRERLNIAAVALGSTLALADVVDEGVGIQLELPLEVGDGRMSEAMK